METYLNYVSGGNFDSKNSDFLFPYMLPFCLLLSFWCLCTNDPSPLPLKTMWSPKHQPSPIWKVSNDSTSSPKSQIYENFAKSFLTSALYSTIQKFWGLMNITPVWSKHQGVFTSSSCWLQDRIRKYAVLLFSPKMTWGWRSKCGCSLVHVRIRWGAFSLLSSSCVTRVTKSE